MAWICPGCQRPIEDEEALLCLYCGASLSRPIGNFGKIKSLLARRSLLILIFIFILVIGFLILQIF